MDLIIVGAGSVGCHISQNIQEYGNFNLLGFVDDAPEKQGKKIYGYDVLGKVDTLLNLKNIAVVVGIAFPKIKARIVRQLSANKTLSFPTLISPRAWISNGSTIGAGCIIYPGATINYGCKIHDYVVINMNCSIGHECCIGDFSSLAPGVNLAGHTAVGKEGEIGIGASTKQSVKIGDFAIIGGQAMIIKDVEQNTRVIGVPGKQQTR